ncbi:MAG: hypothetical protein IIA75_11770, partial [Proteobacteria bacterium]|nr:hypothetical protein [Pseudomonadota bacterium]
MPVLESKLDTRSATFKQNRSDMIEMLETLEELYAEAAEGGGRRTGRRQAARRR